MRPLQTLLLAASISALLAGCLSTAPVDIKSTLDETALFGGYHWMPLQRTDAQGLLLENVSFDRNRTDVPLAVQQYVQLGGGEPTIGFDSQKNAYLTVYDEILKIGPDYKGWNLVHRFTSPGYPAHVDRWETFGQSLWVDHPSDRVFVANMYSDTSCNDLQWSDDGGDTWTDRPLAWCHLPYFMSYPKLVSGPAKTVAVDPRGGGPTFKNNVYLCALTTVLSTECATSLDGGATFAYASLLGGSDGLCKAGPTGHPAIAADGTVIIPMGLWATTGGFLRYSSEKCHHTLSVFVSDDNGLTWDQRQAPTMIENDEMSPDIAFTPDGTAYLVYRNRADQGIYLMRSKDAFATWQGPYRVSPAHLNITAFTAIAAGDDGRIAVGYFGTATNQEQSAYSAGKVGGDTRTFPPPAYANPSSHWHAFVTTSVDAASDAPTFLTQQVSPIEDPVEVGCILQAGWFFTTQYQFPFAPGGPQDNGLPDCQNVRNFIDIASDSDGRFVVAFTDGCSTRVGCATDTQGGYAYRDHEVAVAILDSGPGLKAGTTLASLGLQHAPPKPRGTDNPIPQ